jgi:hypothetical protein
MSWEYTDIRLRNEAEAGLSQMLTKAGFTVYTRVNAPETFKRPRPRLELKVRIGAATGHRHVCADGLARFDGFRVVVGIQTVTAPQNDGVNALNEAYLARLRSVMSALAAYTFDNEKDFPDIYFATPFKDSGTDDTLSLVEGIEYSLAHFESIIAIRTTAWPTQQ